MLLVSKILFILLITIGLTSIGYCLFTLLRKNTMIENPDFTTKHGLKVFLSEETLGKIMQSIVEDWVYDIALILRHHSYENITNSIKGVKIEFIDSESILYHIDGQLDKAVGISYIDEKQVYIASYVKDTTDVSIDRLESLVKHELAHFVVAKLEGLWDDDSSHKYMSKYGL